jgi:hypothetical protein
MTKDEVPTTVADLALDARHGYLIGKVQIGEPATFLILAADPREDVEVLLDTNRYAVFAIKQGSIARNVLETAGETAEAPKTGGWLGYTPPPMALPLSYRDVTKWNRWDTRSISGIFIAAVLLDRQFWPSQDEASEQQVGDLEDHSSGEIRGFRFGAVGTLNFKRPWVYTLFLASSAFDRGFNAETGTGVQVYDLRLDIPLGGDTILSVGKQKEPISMERLTSLIYLPMTERGVVGDALLPKLRARHLFPFPIGKSARRRSATPSPGAATVGSSHEYHRPPHQGDVFLDPCLELAELVQTQIHVLRHLGDERLLVHGEVGIAVGETEELEQGHDPRPPVLEDSGEVLDAPIAVPATGDAHLRLAGREHRNLAADDHPVGLDHLLRQEQECALFVEVEHVQKHRSSPSCEARVAASIRPAGWPCRCKPGESG